MPKKTFLLIVIPILIFTIVTGLLLGSKPVSTPTEIKIESEVGRVAPGAQIRYTGPLDTQIKELPTYKVRTTPISEMASTIAHSLNLLPHPKVPNLWLSLDSKTSLSIEPDANQITLALSFSETPAEPLDITQAAQMAQEYLEKMGLPNFSVEREKISYLPKSENHSNDDIVLLVPVSQDLSNLPVLFDFKISLQQSIWFENGQISKVTLTPGFEADEIGIKDLISPPEAIKNIQSGLGTVIKVDSTEQALPVQNFELSQAVLNKAALEYRVEQSSSLARPYYHFYGQTSQDGAMKLIEIITPAVSN